VASRPGRIERHAERGHHRCQHDALPGCRITTGSRWLSLSRPCSTARRSESARASASCSAHFHGDPNIVEVYLGHLRKKIDHPFGRAASETVRGAGYRIAADGG
jgi:hypothetical protein